MSTLFEYTLIAATIMGVITSTLSYYMTKNDDPDPVTTLTSREKFVLQTSWIPIRKDLTNNGVALLLLFFENFPEEKNHFPFKELSNAELKNCKRFQAHCNTVMTSFDSLIANLHDSELLVNLLEKIGKSHKRHGIKSGSFKRLEETILKLFADSMNKEALQVWRKLLDVAFSVIIKQL